MSHLGENIMTPDHMFAVTLYDEGRSSLILTLLRAIRKFEVDVYSVIY
jgi:hypothetical protein